MILLGIDPGLRYTGYGIITKQNNKKIIIDFGCLSLPPTKTVMERLYQIHLFFKEKIEQYKITHIALETPFLGKNSQSFLKLGYIRGALYILCAQYNIILLEFSPREIKQSITGYGGATKEQVAFVIQKLFPTLPQQSKADITDALAVTLCGIWENK